MSISRKTIYSIGLFSLVFIVICLTRYTDFIFMLPYGTHDEAQADRLAVAMRFFDTGMDFFHPRTYHIYATDAITPVEFPIHSYLAALLGHIFGRENINTSFRLLTLAIAYSGLLALFLTALRATKDVVTSLFVPIFTFCSPIYAYYACTYMPDPAAVSISFIGFYFFLRYYEDGGIGILGKAIFFFTLAALIKTTVGIVLLAVMGYTLLDALFIKQLVRKKDLSRIVLYYSLSIAILLFYYFYNQHLIDKYHGFIFLMRVIPFGSWEEFNHYIRVAIPDQYLNEYFVVVQYIIGLALLIWGAVLLYKDKHRKALLLLPAIMFTGVLITSYLFGHQLIYHDYYFLSIWMPSVIITILLMVITIRRYYTGKKVSVFNNLLLLCLIPCLVFAHTRINRRITMDERQYPGAKPTLSTNWMQNGSKKLDKTGIGRDSLILVLDENAANIGLVYFDRPGMNVMQGAWRGNIFNVRDYMLDHDIHIMVCDARKMPEIETTYARHFYEFFKEVYRDDSCAVYYLTH